MKTIQTACIFLLTFAVSCAQEKWPRITYPDKLVEEISSLIENAPTNSVLEIDKEDWPTQIAILKPIGVNVFRGEFVAISLGVIPMDNSYGYAVFPIPQTNTPYWGRIPMNPTKDTRIFRFQ